MDPQHHLKNVSQQLQKLSQIPTEKAHHYYVEKGEVKRGGRLWRWLHSFLNFIGALSSQEVFHKMVTQLAQIPSSDKIPPKQLADSLQIKASELRIDTHAELAEAETVLNEARLAVEVVQKMASQPGAKSNPWKEQLGLITRAFSQAETAIEQRRRELLQQHPEWDKAGAAAKRIAENLAILNKELAQEKPPTTVEALFEKLSAYEPGMAAEDAGAILNYSQALTPLLRLLAANGHLVRDMRLLADSWHGRPDGKAKDARFTPVQEQLIQAFDREAYWSTRGKLRMAAEINRAVGQTQNLSIAQAQRIISRAQQHATERTVAEFAHNLQQRLAGHSVLSENIFAATQAVFLKTTKEGAQTQFHKDIERPGIKCRLLKPDGKVSFAWEGHPEANKGAIEKQVKAALGTPNLPQWEKAMQTALSQTMANQLANAVKLPLMLLFVPVLGKQPTTSTEIAVQPVFNPQGRISKLAFTTQISLKVPNDGIVTATLKGNIVPQGQSFAIEKQADIQVAYNPAAH